MSYTHTLSIQGVHATLQMNVEHSVVRYTLTLRGDSGEEVVAHGQLPNSAMDQFMVINQYVKNPISVTTAEQGVQANLEQSVTDHIITDVVDFIAQGQQAFLQANMAVSHPSLEIPSESFSPILPSSPKHVDDCLAKGAVSFEHNLSNKKFVMAEEPKMAESFQCNSLIQLTGEPVPVPFSELSVMKQLQQLREYSNPDIKNGIVQAVQDYLLENNVNLLDYCVLCEFVKELFYEMIVLHVDDNVLVGKFIKMLYLAGEHSDDVSQFMSRIWRKYQLFCKVAAYYKITLNSTSFASYRKWNAAYDGPALDPWYRMKTFLLQ
jgi:hypothetical protein